MVAHSISRELIPNQDLDFWNSNFKILFWANLGPKIQTCPFCLKIGAHSISRLLILNPQLDFCNPDLRIQFGRKSQICPFCLKITRRSMSRVLILIQDLGFWFVEPKRHFWEIWAENFKVVGIVWKLVHTVSKCSMWSEVI